MGFNKDQKKALRYNPPQPPKISLADEETYKQGNSKLNMYDPSNPDTNMFNLVDGELVAIAGSELFIYRYARDNSFDPVYDEHRGKVVYLIPVRAYGHYDPRPVEENLSEFGIELTNDQVFTFNKAHVENSLQRPLVPGDIIKPRFQNLFFEVYEVQEDSFESYGVFHLVCTAKLLRDAEDLLKDVYVDDSQIE